MTLLPTGEVRIPGSVTARGIAAFRALPVNEVGGPAESYWHARRDTQQLQDGDVWVAGHAGFGAGDRNFGLGTNGPGLIMKIEGSSGKTTFNREVNVDADLRIRGRAVAIGPWIAGHFDCGPPVVNVNITGQCLWTVTRSSTGVYVVTFTEPHPRGDSYTVLATIPAGGSVTWAKTATSLTLRAYSINGQPTDPAELNFTTIP